MRELSKKDIHLVLSRIPKDVVSLMRDDPRLCIAGGIIRALIGQEIPSDIDMFGPSKEVLDATADKLAEARKERGEHSRKHSTGNAITLTASGRLPVQLITRWTFSDPKDVVTSFDFTICLLAPMQN